MIEVVTAPSIRLNNGYQNVTVYNRTASKCEPLLAKGAKMGKSPLEVAANAEVLFSIMAYPHQLSELVFPSKVAAVTTNMIITVTMIMTVIIRPSLSPSLTISIRAQD